VVQVVSKVSTSLVDGTSEPDSKRSTQVSVVTAGRTPVSPAELLGSTALRDLLSEVANDYDVVVLDSSPLLSVVDTHELVPHVEGILFCLRPDRTTREQALAAKHTLDRLPSPPVGLVLTGVRKADQPEYGYYSATAYQTQAD
jgi:Mrp family chromosome partitioning ATPase